MIFCCIEFKLISGFLETSRPPARRNAIKTRREQNRYETQVLDLVKPTLKTILCGQSNWSDSNSEKSTNGGEDEHMDSDADSAAHFTHRLSQFFCREPMLLQSVLKHIVKEKPKARKVFFHGLFDVRAIEEGILHQNVALKNGGKIPDKRWTLKFSPIFQHSVWLLLF